jgi:type I restriction enzyme S subunit
MLERQSMTFGELGEFFDGPHATPTRRSDGPYFLNIASLKSGRLDLAESDHVSREDFARWTRRVTPQKDDLLFSYETRLGEAASMPGGIEACLGRRMALLRPDQSVIDPRFLLYFYLSPAFQRTIERNMIHGATVSRIGLAAMPDWRVQIPRLREQRAIAEVLGALDDKIAANDRIVELADELARQEFRAACADAVSVPLSSLAQFANGKAYTKHASGTGRVVVRIAELNSGLGSSTVYNEIEVPEENLARPGDLLFAWSGSLRVARWYRPEAIVNQHIFKVIPNDGVPMWLANQAVQAKLAEFTAIAADKTTTMGHIQRRHLDEPVRVPSAETIKDLDSLMDGLWRRALAAEVENLRLAKTRDEILPLLMSGGLPQ